MSEQHGLDVIESSSRQGRYVQPDRDIEEEIDLLALWQTLLKYKRMILKATFGTAVLVAAITLLLPNIYRAEVLLAPVASEGGKSGLSSALGGLGGLASMAGISLGGGGSIEENLAVLKSRDFLWKFAQEKKLMPILFERSRLADFLNSDPPGQWDLYRLLIEDGNLHVNVDKDSGLITVGVEWVDPVLVAEWANLLVHSLNQHLAQQAIARSESNLKYLNEELMRTPVEEMRKTLFELIASEQKNAMLASTQKEFAFKVLDPAVEPDKKAKPKRALIVILAALVAGFAAILYAFIKDGIAKRREEEMVKKHG